MWQVRLFLITRCSLALTNSAMLAWTPKSNTHSNRAHLRFPFCRIAFNHGVHFTFHVRGRYEGCKSMAAHFAPATQHDRVLEFDDRLAQGLPLSIYLFFFRCIVHSTPCFQLLIPWRFFRLWALADGIDPPENMVRCMANNYSTLGFWRSWHRSYNLWLTRLVTRSLVPLCPGGKGLTVFFFPKIPLHSFGRK